MGNYVMNLRKLSLGVGAALMLAASALVSGCSDKQAVIGYYNADRVEKEAAQFVALRQEAEEKLKAKQAEIEEKGKVKQAEVEEKAKTKQAEIEAKAQTKQAEMEERFRAKQDEFNQRFQANPPTSQEEFDRLQAEADSEFQQLQAVRGYSAQVVARDGDALYDARKHGDAGFAKRMAGAVLTCHQYIGVGAEPAVGHPPVGDGGVPGILEAARAWIVVALIAVRTCVWL